MLLRLLDQADRTVFEVKDGGRVPVLGGVDVALGGGHHHQEAVVQAQLDNPVAKLQRLPGVVGNIAQGDGLAA